LRITVVGQIFLVAIISMGNILRVQGRPGLGLLFMGGGNLLNVLLAALAIFVLEWGVVGAAWATTVTLAINFSLLLIFVQSKWSILHLHWANLKANS